MVIIPEFILSERINAYLVYRKGTYPTETRDELNLTIKLLELKNNPHEVLLTFDTTGIELPCGMQHGIYEVMFKWKNGGATLKAETLPANMFEDAKVPNELLVKLGLK
jgi:hypothetical protein